MNPLQALDGKKTTIAGGLSAVPAIMIGLDMIWGFLPLYDKVVDTVSLLIGALGSLGLLHKFSKWQASKDGD